MEAMKTCPRVYRHAAGLLQRRPCCNGVTGQLLFKMKVMQNVAPHVTKAQKYEHVTPVVPR